ncbi:MAG TPA: P1 family peptidase [Anaerolineae bacterium]|nr:P1 family peptidase [Anaerolineae bacterium]
MRISIAYNLRTKETEEQAELLPQEDVDRLYKALTALRYKVTPVEVSGKPDVVIERILKSEPQLIFNVAEGTIGGTREAFYPALYENLGIPYTGSGPSVLLLDLNKHLAKAVMSAHGITVPKGMLITRHNKSVPSYYRYPLIIKPNSEGSSKGITQKSVVETPEECQARIEELLKDYPEGLLIEEYIKGRELSIPMLELFPDQVLEIVEHKFNRPTEEAKYNIFDYSSKRGPHAKSVSVECPARLDNDQRERIMALAKRTFAVMDTHDLARVDIRLHEDGTPYFIELNPLPSLHPDNSLMQAAKARGLSYKDVIRLIVGSATQRYLLTTKALKRSARYAKRIKSRPTLRETGASIGYFDTGVNNAITDVKGVKVGHVTHIEDNVEIPGVPGSTSVRTGVTAVLPSSNPYEKLMPAGGFILNGIGEMAGITQVLEWEWLETPILLSNTESVGRVHDGVIDYMLDKYPRTHGDRSVIIPVVGEANDSFLNDTRVRTVEANDAIRAIKDAKVGPVQQGSIGAGTGMTSFDFAGGIGTSSRVLPPEHKGYTIGVLVLSNFGLMRNLTIDGDVVGRELDKVFPKETRKQKEAASVIVVVATNAPMISSQLNRLARRAALGLGRVGSHARATSGEIIIAFSTGNRVSRDEYAKLKHLDMRFVSDPLINLLYEAVVEATEEAVVNAIFCSDGMTGCGGNFSPPIPHDKVLELLGKHRVA